MQMDYGSGLPAGPTCAALEPQARKRHDKLVVHTRTNAEPANPMRIFDPGTDLADMAQPIVRLVQQAGRIRHRDNLVEWLGGPLQPLIPHCAVVAGWGHFDAGEIRFCALGPAPWHQFDSDAESVLRTAHAQWIGCGMQAQVLPNGVCLRGGEGADESLRVLVHGLRDLRVGCDSCYAFLLRPEASIHQVRQAARLLLPTIDLAFRQAAAARNETVSSTFGEEPASTDDDVAADDLQAREQPLSEREEEVMRWVRLGKTNSEIAIILHLSTFTVKNHMRRIYRKLNALNRAQAVSRTGSRTLS